MDSFTTTEAALDPLVAAKLAKLRHVSDDMPGITRHRARIGADYRFPNGEIVRDNAWDKSTTLPSCSAPVRLRGPNMTIFMRSGFSPNSRSP
jgi:hypothetical protein